jgi:glycerophosphocholine phosphodiesterase GPCPD1
MIVKFQLNLDIDDSNTSNFNLNRDTLFLCGSCDYLGNWNLNNAIEMKLKSNLCERGSLSTSCSSLSSNSSWDTTIYENSMNTNLLAFEVDIEIADSNEFTSMASDKPIHYKYFIGQKCIDKTKSRMFLKQVEYTWRKLNLNGSSATITTPSPTSLTASSILIEINDKWGVLSTDENNNSHVRIDHGWLLNNENEIQFHFFGNPIQLWSCNLSQKPLNIKIIPFRTNNGMSDLKDFALNIVNFDDKHLICEKNTAFNAFNNADVYASYRIRTFEKPTDLLFQINVYEFEENGTLNDKTIATGYFKVNKALLDNSVIETDISLMNSNEMVGCLKTEILLTTSLMESNNYLLTKNYNYHFNRSCIPIGHRGMGKTFDADTLPGTNFVENTIESFREAHNRGAQMVEFDIVLTKDKVPIVYHDFEFCINQLQESHADKYLSIAVNQLTYEEIKLNRIYSKKIESKLKHSQNNRDLFTSKQMFPTIKEMCNQLDSKLGFNVEIKYPIDLEDGNNEVEDHIKWLNRNDYVDVILKELYACCADEQRCVIISTFDPNLCSMIRMKQNKFPVLFLTNGITNKWKPYKDTRCKNTQVSLNYAKSEYLHGIVAHAEELSQNYHLINILFNHTSKSANFLAFSWGDDLNQIEKRQLFSQSGINGIIYDRISEQHHVTSAANATDISTTSTTTTTNILTTATATS